nr:kelch repeat-containing protein [uncultured Lacibacter sp.]
MKNCTVVYAWANDRQLVSLRIKLYVYPMKGWVLLSSFLIALCLFSVLSCKPEYSCENCRGKNRPPIAKAGADKTIKLPKDSVLLDGTASTDPDGRITEWLWRKIAGPSSFTIKDTVVSVAAVGKLLPGVYSFELKVTDNEGLFANDTVNVFVDSANVPNRPPVARAGQDQIITLPVSKATLDGSASTDPDNNIIGFAWRKIAGPSNSVFSDPVAVQTEASGLTNGVYQFELTVTDAEGLFSTDTMKVTVNISPNRSPVAEAGNDITVTYNLQTCSIEPSSITLDGKLSRDPDGTIVTYHWSVVFAESSSAIITNPNSVSTTVTNLMPGTYGFQLRVTDNEGAFDDDTIIVNTVYSNRPQLNARLIPIGTLSDPRKVSAVATAGNKIIFAGGSSVPSGPGPSFSSSVDIYDMTTNSWTRADLSLPRSGITVAAMGNKVFFAGGTGILPSGRIGLTSRIDIYDAATNTWDIMEMPHADGQLASLASGNKLVIVGGNFADVYDAVAKRWTTTNFGQPRYLITANNVKGKLFFAGGVTNKSTLTPTSRIDIYDPAANLWSVSQLSKPKYGMSGLFGRNLIWAGGIVDGKTSNEAEMFEPLSGTTSFSCLFQPNAFSSFSSGQLNGKAVFFVSNGKAKNKFDIYDPLTNIWYIGVLNESLTEPVVIYANGNIYVAGTAGNSDGYHRQVWKLEF